MKVLLVADEYFSWGLYGGFGASTRKLGTELARRGVDVEAWVHQISSEQKPVGETEVIDGVPVKTLPRKKPAKLRSKKLYETDADVIHSQCGMFDTYLTFKRNADTPRAVTIQDLRTPQEHKKLRRFETTSGYPWYKRLWAWYVRRCYRKAMQDADVVACEARLLFPKVWQVYHVNPSRLLPNFVDVSNGNFKKAEKPTVLWLARLDPIKQPELCFDVAREMPDVEFNILGKAHAAYGADRDQYFRHKYRDVKNLHFMGFQTGAVKEKMLSEAWILINTSAYECLPVSFLEAMAHECALLSTQNPDDYTAMFGVHAKPTVKSMRVGLEALLMDDTWRVQGKAGREHVEQFHSTEKGVDAHIKLYEELTA